MSKAVSRVAALIAVATGLSAVVGYGLCRQAESAAPVPTAASAKSVIAPMVVGMNLGRLMYWSAEWPFNDLVKNAGQLRVIDAKGGWAGKSDLVQLDATGHPVGVAAKTRLVMILQLGALKSRVGTYQCHISPGWSVGAFGDAKITGSGTSFTLKLPGEKNGSALYVTAATNGAKLSDLSCTDGTALFNPAFLEDNRPFKVLRFMNWMGVNNAPHRDWATRPSPASLTQDSDSGVAVEYMVDLANALKSDPWFNLPYDADPTYYRQFANYVRDHLAKDRKVYVELSNEVWNVSFQQGKENIRLGQARYPGANVQQASDWYYGDRVRDLMAIWTSAFKGQEGRLVRVLASQAVNPLRAEQALSHNDTWKSVDALATAPYFGKFYKGTAAPGPERVNAIFESMPAGIDEAIRYAKAGKAVANRYGLRYVAYETGPSLTSGGNATLAEDNFTAAHDPRMYTFYTQFLNRWRNEVGDVLVLFDSISNPNRDAWYGHKQYTGQPLSEAPKMRAAVDAASRTATP
ncbi:hypothetical protein [Sphingomonas quercus]|uniref:Cellulose-binding protein n=1 Tax=Sphingomonas quercus TaxID=2842451 RepID=A0ABS6BFX2_9SPHN|nr:hypothetical protein [Sphingomonas quercus]MBU3077192.1 hypothetical protein [Sphingomonas quercus]